MGDDTRWDRGRRQEATRGEARRGARRLFSTVGDLTMVRGRRWDDAMRWGRGDACVGPFAVDEGRRGATCRAREWMRR